MVSEPNFVLGIKQISLHNKEDSYMHSTDSQCPCLASDLDFTHHAATMAHCCVKILKPKQSMPLSSNMCKSKLRLMKPTPQTCSKTSHDQNPRTWPPIVSALATTRNNGSGASPTCHRNSRLLGRIMITHAA